VLVVDDNHDIADSVALVLRLEGHETQVAYDGYEALELAPGFRPDAVLLDLGLPGLSGHEVAVRLRALPELSATVLVAVSGRGQQSDLEASRVAGFAAHLVKPVDPEMLARRLRELCAERAVVPTRRAKAQPELAGGSRNS
jgi:CheY-like chemotaxis protein